jgi:hypothetical protein
MKPGVIASLFSLTASVQLDSIDQLCAQCQERRMMI